MSDRPDLTLIDQRQLATGRVRSLLRTKERGAVSWFVAEIDRLVDCGRNWNRAAELLVAPDLPGPCEPRRRHP